MQQQQQRQRRQQLQQGRPYPVRPIHDEQATEELRGADEREMSEMGEKEEDELEAKEDSLSQEAAEA